MNPLDAAELQHFARKLNEEMPIHTETTAKIKRSYSQGMPKNLMEYSAHIDNKFLNDNLAIIEEIAHRDQKHPIPKWFRDYQIKHYAKYGILKADGFFPRDRILGRMFPREIYYGAGANYHNMGIMSVIGNTKVFGSTIETFASGGVWGNRAADQMLAMYSTTTVGIAGQFYDQIAINSDNTTGNIKLGVYDESASKPNNLLSSLAKSMTADYAWNSVTEFALTTNNTWLAYVKSSASNLYEKTGMGTVYYRNLAYASSFTNPFGTEDGSGTQGVQEKIGHS